MDTFGTVTFSDITSSGMKVTLERNDNTFVVDYPVWCDFSDGSHIVSYNNPEQIPSEIRDTIETVILYTREAFHNEAIREANEHGHPNWSHAMAYGPCTLPSVTTENNCHCGTSFGGSDHCPYCYCEQYESYCGVVRTRR